MAKDIFPGWGKGPSKDEIEREAARELERLTRQAGPSPYNVDAGPSVSAGVMTWNPCPSNSGAVIRWMSLAPSGWPATIFAELSA